jgi:hypothetical protein
MEEFMLRYLVALVVLAAGIFTSAFLVDGIGIKAVLDFPGFIISIIMPFLFVSIIFWFKKMSNAFSISLQKEPEKDKLKPALNFFKNYRIITWIAGILGVIVGFIAMLVNLDDRENIGAFLAKMLVSPLYSAIIYMLIIIPFSVFINKNLKEL